MKLKNRQTDRQKSILLNIECIFFLEFLRHHLSKYCLYVLLSFYACLDVKKKQYVKASTLTLQLRIYCHHMPEWFICYLVGVIFVLFQSKPNKMLSNCQSVVVVSSRIRIILWWGRVMRQVTGPNQILYWALPQMLRSYWIVLTVFGIVIGLYCFLIATNLFTNIFFSICGHCWCVLCVGSTCHVNLLPSTMMNL